MNPRGHLSSETIDLLLLSALAAGEANEAKAHLDTCEACRTRWRELNEDKQKFEQFVFARTLPKVEARLVKERAQGGFFERFRVMWLLPAMGVAAAAVFGVVALTGPGTQTEDELYIGVKGASPSLEVVALRGETQFPVKSGAELKPKDRIRFVVNPAGAQYVLIASRDGAGVFTVYHPFGAAESVKLDSALPKKLELPGSVELDDTLGTEHLVAVFSSQPVKSADVEAALKADAAAPKVPNASVLTWEFRKAQ
ncbi:MAG: hypothetical protein AMXMBFR34_42190 [Myxococcaceae bacterium]